MHIPKMFPALRVPFIRIIYSYLATITWCISLWNRADMLRDHLADSRSSVALPSNETYDFIVVGAGSSGAVVANRLSDRFHSVLLLEAGGEPFPISQIPGLSLTLLNSPEIDWMHKTVTQSGACHSLKNSESLWSQGKGLGGTSNMNTFLIHSRGSRQDFDNWAKITGDPSWRYDGVLPYFKKSEDFHGIYSQTGYHGKGGPIRVEISPERRAGDLFVNAAQELGYLKVDLNGNYTEGFDNVYYNVKNGRREGAFNGYLKPIRKGRKLKILKFAHVNKVLLRGDGNEAYGVEYIRDGQKRTAFSSKEIILSAGAIQSPKLLMLSGIGPKEHLELHNIKVKVNSPAVGKNLQDHISVYLGPFFVDTGKSFLLDRDLRGQDFIDYYLRGTGILGTTGLQAMGFISTLNSQSSVNNNKENHIRKWPNIQLLFSPVATYANYAQDFSRTFNVQQDLSQKYYEHSKGRDSFTIITSLARPEQRGDILLESNNPYAPLRIDPRYLQNENDVQTLVDGIKMAVNLVETAPSFKDIGANFTTERFPGCEHQEFRSDAYWECFARQLSITLHNFVGTCAMGPANNPSSSVVDPELLVVGAKNLRVIDAAVMPVIPLGGTNAACVMIGEKGADMILKRWKPARSGRNRGETLSSKTLENASDSSNKPAEDDSRNNNDDNIFQNQDVLKHTISNPLNMMEQWLNATLIMQTPSSDSKTLPTTKLLTKADVDIRAAINTDNRTNLPEPKLPTTSADMDNESIIYSQTRNQPQPVVPVQSLVLVNHSKDGNAQISGLSTANDGRKSDRDVAREGKDKANNINPPAVVIEPILSTSKPMLLSHVTPKNSNGDQFSVNVIARTPSSGSEPTIPNTTSNEAFQMSPRPQGKNIKFIADTATSNDKKWNVTGLLIEELVPESVTVVNPTIMSEKTTSRFETTETTVTNQPSKSKSTTTASSKPNTLTTTTTDSQQNFPIITNSPPTSYTKTTSSEQVSSIMKPQSLSSTTTVSEPISSTVASAPNSSTSAFEPISSTTASAPISSTSTSEPIFSLAISEPISSTAASEPISSTTASAPISSASASEPISSTSESGPISSTVASEPIFSTTASEPISSLAASAPISSTTVPTEYKPVSSTPKANSQLNSTTELRETNPPEELLVIPNLGKEDLGNLKSRQNSSRSFSLFSDLDTRVNVSNPEIVLPNNYSTYSQKNANILPQTGHPEKEKEKKVPFFNLNNEPIPTSEPGLYTSQWNDMVTEVTTLPMLTSPENPVDVSVANIPSEKIENQSIPSENGEAENTGKTAIKEIVRVNSTSVSGGNLKTVLNWMTILPLITATAIQLHAQQNWVLF